MTVVHFHDPYDMSVALAVGGDGDDTFVLSLRTDTVDGGNGFDTVVVDGPAGVILDLAAGTVTSRDLADHAVLTLVSIEQIAGGMSNDILIGDAGANRLDGGRGRDTVSYAGVGGAVQADLSLGRASGAAGEDTLVAIENLSGGAGADTLIGSGRSNRLNGGAGNDTLAGGDGNDRLNGAGGADLLEGGAGDDVYVVDRETDQATEAAGAGHDTVIAARSWTLGANFEDLSLSGAAAIDAIGNDDANALRGNVGNNVLDGRGGADLLIGLAGDDTYVVDGADTIEELSDGGDDLVLSSVDWVLGAGLEGLTLVAASTAVRATGNALDNRITGNALANVLDGQGGNDTMTGGAGDDVYLVDATQDEIVEGVDGGIDTVRSSAVSTRLAANVENGVLVGQGFSLRTLTGNDLNNKLTGSPDDDDLSGYIGDDTMVGGAGSDTYFVGEVGDRVIEGADQGVDTVRSRISWTLPSNVEDLVLVLSDDLNATGNTADNHLYGNTGDNVIDGRGGADFMDGWDGNDTYIVDDVGDRAMDTGDGIDRARSSVSFDLDASASGVEILQLVGTTALDGWGSATGNDTLSGNAGDNRLDGRGGYDVVSFANATHAVDVNLRTGIATGFGTDTLQNVEHVIGSRGSDWLRGNDQSNAFTGGNGFDRFVFDNALAGDYVFDFTTGVDRLLFSQTGLPIGDGDLAVDGARTVAGPGGFGPNAELVVLTTPVTLSSTTAIAAALDHAGTAYAIGQTALFVVHDGRNSEVYLFESADAGATIEAAELTRLVSLFGTTSVAPSDFGWIA